MNPTFRELLDRKIETDNMTIDQQIYLTQLKRVIVTLNGLHERAEMSVNFSAEMFDKHTELNIISEHLKDMVKKRETELNEYTL